MSKRVARPTTVDGVLKEWGERYDWDSEAKRPELGSNRRGTGRSRGPRAPAPSAADKVRATLKAIANRPRQAVFKITGGGKTARQIDAHLRYISRNGQLALEDQEGIQHEGAMGCADIVLRWETVGAPLPVASQHREAFNIVLSPGRGSDAAATLQAARDFAHEQFPDRDYALVLHAPETDPSQQKSEHPHVHLVVKARDANGRKLNPRKADLHAYRQAYARHLRANGIDAIAVKREALFKRAKGEKQGLVQMRKRGQIPRRDATARSQPEAVARALANEAVARELYGDVVKALASSPVPGDAALASQLRRALPIEQAPAATRPPRGPTRA